MFLAKFFSVIITFYFHLKCFNPRFAKFESVSNRHQKKPTKKHTFSMVLFYTWLLSVINTKFIAFQTRVKMKQNEYNMLITTDPVWISCHIHFISHIPHSTSSGKTDFNQKNVYRNGTQPPNILYNAQMVLCVFINFY